MKCKLSTLIFVILFLFPLVALAENIDPDSDGSQYAWGENVGWINFEPSQGGGVTVADSAVTGKAWGENIGWINLSPATGGVGNDGAGNLSGFAWGENVGWINFNPTGAGVKINPATGVFSGMAWGENIGWINFAPNGKPVKTSWRGVVDQCPNDPNKTEPGICGCGVPDTDSDVDGTPNCNDGCPNDPNKTQHGVCGCGNPDTDTDTDGIKDCKDNCPTIVNLDQRDSDGDGTGDVCDLITVTTPNGGEVIPSGGTYAICWKAPASIVKVDLFYSIDNGTSWNFIKSVTGLSCTHWEIPVVTANKKKCLVKAIGYNASGVKLGEDMSDRTFTIEVVRVLSPNGGETLTSGNKWTIKWLTNKTVKPVAKIALQYTTNGTIWNPIPIRTLSGNPNPGVYSWLVPNVSSTKCKVKVILKDASGVNIGTDVSNGVFTIQP